MNFFLHTGNTFSTDIVYNLGTQFIVEIPRRIDLHGQWEVGLVDVIIKNQTLSAKNSVAYICCDFVENSVYGNRSIPCLRCVYVPRTLNDNFIHLSFEKPFYFNVTSNFIQNVNVWMIDDAGEIIKSTLEDLVFLTFHFRRLR